MSLYFLLSYMSSLQYSVFQQIGLMHERYQFCPWCYEDMSMVLWRNVPGVTRSKKYTPISLLNYILHVNDDVWTSFLHRLKSNILWNNVLIHNFNAKCLWCYTIFMVTPLTVTPQKTGKYFQYKRKIISPWLYFICISCEEYQM